LARILQMLGLPWQFQKSTTETRVPPEVEALALQREKARIAHKWDEADLLRDALLEQGWEVRDNSGGFEINRTKGNA
ncbi:MAG: cysteinyl-tRNA synthetase, partial [Lentimonas sp.]